MKFSKGSSNSLILNQSGQVVVEYLLIMVLVVSIAAALTKSLVGRSENNDSQGLIIKGWNNIIKAIGNDLPDCPKQTDLSNPNCPP